MVSVYTLLPAFFAGIVIGAIASMIFGRLFRRASAPTTTEVASSHDQEQQHKDREIEVDRLVRSIYELTSHVDSQVGQHSQKVSEITNTLSGTDSPDGESDQILVAGKMLLQANEKLQSDLEEAKQEIQRQREQLNSTIAESQTDPLTGLANRRALDMELSHAFAQRRRDKSNLSVLIIDIDHFKKINDQYGHMVGDQLLKCFARCLKNTLRETDFVARFGGEEFVVILKKTPLEDAFKAAERVRSIVAANPHKVGDFEIKVTASFGVKEAGEGETEAFVLQKADEALYAAKKGGRNCCFYHDGQTCQQFEYEAETEQPLAADPKSATVGGSVAVAPENLAKSSKKSVGAVNADKSVQL